MKAIETKYKGYRFRSRLEARWAVFFDALGVKWEYEKEGYDLGEAGWYLPDFWLPDVSLWAEVKPGGFDTIAMQKASLLVKSTGHGCVLLDGVPDCVSYEYIYIEEAADGEIFMSDLVISQYHGYPQHEHRFYSDTGWEDRKSPDDFRFSGMFDDVPAAVAAARSARFEHGEVNGS